VTTLLAAPAGGTAVTTGYYVNDMVATQAQGAVTRAWTLDPAARLRQASGSNTPTQLLHYTDVSSDAPSWLDESKGSATLSATRYVRGLDENLAAREGHDRRRRWELLGVTHGRVPDRGSSGGPAADRPDAEGEEYGGAEGQHAGPRQLELGEPEGHLHGEEPAEDQVAHPRPVHLPHPPSMGAATGPGSLPLEGDEAADVRRETASCRWSRPASAGRWR
jgi:hypothetical protein